MSFIDMLTEIYDMFMIRLYEKIYWMENRVD